MLRETTFWIGGALTIGLGVALAAGLVWAGAGPGYASAYLGAGLGVLLGGFFLFVGREEGAARRRFLREATAAPPDGSSTERPR
jgi:hypothetical protein